MENDETREKAKDAARAKAEEQYNEPDPIVLELTSELNVTSAKDFLLSTRKKQEAGAVKTPGGFTFSIQAVEPGALMIATGSPLFADLVAQVQKTGKPVQASDDDVIKLIGDPKFIAGVKSIVCLGITSINFANKPEEECDLENEVPIDRLPFADLMVAYKAITELSTGQGGLDQFRYFQVSDSGE